MPVILIGVLDGTVAKPFLVNLVDVDTPNYANIQQTVIATLHNVLGKELVYDNVKLFLTDGASYCLKAGKALKAIFPKLIHMTCMAHSINRVAELARTTYPRVNTLISEVKKIFMKSIQRRRNFSASCKIPLPPEPVITR